MGLARAFSKLGFCSRSQAVAWIQAGKVKLNGRVRRDPETPVHLSQDKIQVDDHTVVARDFVYLMLNKPRGIVTTASDEKGRETVYSYLDKGLPWVAPVGRLDKASEGLLLLTNDSEWAARILDPDSRVEKTYHVQIDSTAPERIVADLRNGLVCDGEILRILRAGVLRQGKLHAWLEVALNEGKNRHIRKMLAACGVNVLRLVRVSIGSLVLGTIGKGTTRRLSAAEKSALDPASRDP